MGIFSMAGDGETVVKIGSAFLPTKEANHLLELFNKDKSIEVAISAKPIDAETLKSLRSENSILSDTIREQKELRRKQKKTFSTKEVLDNPDLLSDNQTVDDVETTTTEHDEL